MRPTLVLLPIVLAAAACGPGDGGNATCKGLLPGDLVITEVQSDYDAPTGASAADAGHEWFEIYNASAAPIELEGLVLGHSHPDGSSPKTHKMGKVTIDAGQYLVLGDILPDLAPAYVDYGYANDLGDLYNTGGGKLSLTCGATLVDEAIYDQVEPGHTRELDGGSAPDYQQNDQQSNWCTTGETAELEFEPSNFGTPGAANVDCMTVTPGQCNDGGTMRPTVPPQVGDLTITEVMPSPSAVSDTVGEWFEVLVNRDVDLNDLALDRAGDSSAPVVLSSPTCKHVTAGTYLVFARNDVMGSNGGLPRVDGVFTFSLVPGSAASPGDVRILMGATELDSVSWTSSRNGKSLQLNAGLTMPTDNDTAGNLCDGATTYGAGDFGTPGAANATCGTTTNGMCFDTGTMAMRPIVKPTAGQLVISEWMPDPTLVTDTAGEWFEVRATAPVDLNGLQAGTTALGATPIVPASGNCLRLTPGADEWAVFARNGVSPSNGCLPAVDATMSLSQTQSNGTLQIGIDGAALDTKTWTTSMPGRSIMIDSQGRQCNAPDAVLVYNTSCNGMTGNDRGTPGAVNSPPDCP